MRLCLYLSHPQVKIDPGVPVPQWDLSAEGLARAKAFAARDLIGRGTPIFTSAEPKAKQFAAELAKVSRSPIITHESFGENDRSATGFLPPEEFERHADAFFAQPDQSVGGWETANAALARIVAAVRDGLKQVPPSQRVVFCGHGAVGTLLKCYLGRRPVARTEDQIGAGLTGGGNGFAFDFEGRRLLGEWTPMEQLARVSS
ncbi:histidine phosphatase family protein [Devosia sp.]|uniref:histidine phosphatase family protein n=1 Tax=Devosia sp. TaxID=1871048 RepID=UPI003263C17B